MIDWRENKKTGGSYSGHRALLEKHVVVTTRTPNDDLVMDFLNEFYSHSELQDYHVILLSAAEIETNLRMVLHLPLWSQRVIYINGTPLKDDDLHRARYLLKSIAFMTLKIPLTKV